MALDEEMKGVSRQSDKVRDSSSMKKRRRGQQQPLSCHELPISTPSLRPWILTWKPDHKRKEQILELSQESSYPAFKTSLELSSSSEWFGSLELLAFRLHLLLSSFA